jgi:pSer/pThr/pTyr-binding forkhead associated (FHA) protein
MPAQSMAGLLAFDSWHELNYHTSGRTADKQHLPKPLGVTPTMTRGGNPMTDPRQSAGTLTVSRGPGVGRRFSIGAAPVTIGRDAQCDIQVDDTWVSRRHARIAWSGTEYIVEDLGSTNGTYVNSERLGAPRALQSGDLLQLGEQVELAFQMSVPAPLEEVSVLPDFPPSPRGEAGLPRAHAPRSQPIPGQKGPSLRRGKTGVWALALAGLLLSLIVAGGAYHLLSDKRPQVADAPAAQAVPPQPAATPTPIAPRATSTSVPPAATPTPIAPRATPTSVPPATTPTPINAQADTTFVGPMTISRRGTNASAQSGEIEFQTSADGAAVVSLAYSLIQGKCSYVSGSASTTITGSSKSTLYPEEPVPITNGRFILDFMGIQVTGNLDSPLEAHGEITIRKQETIQSPSYQQFTCDYGTWTWNAEAQ